jgi:hypothetical protein
MMVHAVLTHSVLLVRRVALQSAPRDKLNSNQSLALLVNHVFRAHLWL